MYICIYNISCPAILSRISTDVRARDSRPAFQRSLMVTWRTRHVTEVAPSMRAGLFLSVLVRVGWVIFVCKIAFYYRHPRFYGRQDASRSFIGLPNSRSSRIFRRFPRRSVVFAATETLTSSMPAAFVLRCFFPSSAPCEASPKITI